MNLQELLYDYPSPLVATEPRADFRCLSVDEDSAQEISREKIFDLFRAKDVLVINDTQVLPRRVFAKEPELEVLFVQELEDGAWEVLFPASRLKADQHLQLPGGVELRLEQKGLPQKARPDQKLDEAYFLKHGELALPPYIQQARQQRHMRDEDRSWYQTDWAQKAGSCAAPTASLHFQKTDLQFLKKKGVAIAPITLHVGLGTFLPIKSENISEHVMHKEWCRIPKPSADAIAWAKAEGGRVWALGTTVTRTLESWAAGMLSADEDGNIQGESRLFIRPGFDFRLVDMLMTNFHQPGSTLLALVCAFAGHERVMAAYEQAIAKEFRLFSYGDLSIWQRM